MSTETRENDPGAHASRGEPGLLDALVQAERASMDPPADGERQSQTWTRVVASVAVGGPPPVVPASISGPATTVTSLWVKIVLGVIVGGVVAAAGFGLAPDPEPEPVATAVADSQNESDETPPSPTSRPVPVAARPTPVSPGTHAEFPAPAQPATAVPPTGASAPKPARTAPADPPTSNLTEETRLLARARARLRAGSPGDALIPLGEHARRFPHGQLTEDRLVLQAQALCESGDTKAGLKKAAALRKAFPGSSHLPRVQRSCRP